MRANSEGVLTEEGLQAILQLATQKGDHPATRSLLEHLISEYQPETIGT